MIIIPGQEPDETLTDKFKEQGEELMRKLAQSICPCDLQRHHQQALQAHQVAMENNVPQMAFTAMAVVIFCDFLALHYIDSGYITVVEGPEGMGWTIIKPHLITCTREH